MAELSPKERNEQAAKDREELQKIRDEQNEEAPRADLVPGAPGSFGTVGSPRWTDTPEEHPDDSVRLSADEK